MSKLIFENEFYKYESVNEDTVITILQDNNMFFNVDITGCKLITDKNGLIKDDFTTGALHQMYKYCNENKASKSKLKLDIRSKTIDCVSKYL